MCLPTYHSFPSTPLPSVCFIIALALPCPTTLTFRATDKVWHMFKGRRLSKDEICYDRVLSQLVKLAFDMFYKLLFLNRLFNVEIHKNKNCLFCRFLSVTFAFEYQS